VLHRSLNAFIDRSSITSSIGSSFWISRSCAGSQESSSTNATHAAPTKSSTRKNKHSTNLSAMCTHSFGKSKELQERKKKKKPKSSNHRTRREGRSLFWRAAKIAHYGYGVEHNDANKNDWS
jgi:hypothetical protein